MAIPTDSFDLGGLRLSAGEARRLDLAVTVDPFELGGERYAVTPDHVPVSLAISRTTQNGWALRLRLAVGLRGPCMRCLSDATPHYAVDAWEVSQPGVGAELDSPYLRAGGLDLRGWAHDALALVLPTQIVCSPDCPGLCPVCGVGLARAGADHAHEAAPDPRWAKLSALRFDG